MLNKTFKISNVKQVLEKLKGLFQKVLFNSAHQHCKKNFKEQKAYKVDTFVTGFTVIRIVIVMY